MKENWLQYEACVARMDMTLRVGASFDLIKRKIGVGQDELTLYYIDGFIKDGVMLRLMQHFISLKKLPEGVEAAEMFANTQVPYVEVETTGDMERMVLMVMSGGAVILGSTFGDTAILVDARTYPARETAEPENDRVMQGARDGFVETLIFNTALIRRRIRDPRLTMEYVNLGGSSCTDVVVCYLDGVADPTYLKRLTKRLREIHPKSLTMGFQSLAEMLIPRKWYNPFPKVRVTERPDTAAAQLVEGSVLVLCDTAPQVMVLPTSIFDFLQETDDFYFPPVTGTYLRLLRLVIFSLSFVVSPTWYLFIMHPEWLPEGAKFIIPTEPGAMPILLQLFLVEFAIDGLKLASMNTPNLLSHSLSVIGGLILGDFAVTVGWLSPDVIFYMAIVAIAGFSQQSHELSYAVKFFRLTCLALTAIFGLWGYVVGVVLLPIFILLNSTLGGGRRYLSPLIPFRPRAFCRLLFRLKKDDYEDDGEGGASTPT